ncbi:MAG: RHS repeat-associated core domain-containing protein [Acidimicrobiales bacterium]
MISSRPTSGSTTSRTFTAGRPTNSSHARVALNTAGAPRTRRLQTSPSSQGPCYASGTLTPRSSAKRPYSHDALGRVISEAQDVDGHSVTYTRTLDAYRIQSETKSGVANAVTSEVHTPLVTFTYDHNGNLTEHRVEDTTGNTVDRVTTLVYDTADRVISETDPTGAVTTTTYDTGGRIATVTDPIGRIRRMAYDATGNPIGETIENFIDDPDNPTPYERVIVTRTFDALGRPTSTTNEFGITTEMVYDSAGRLVSEVVADYDDGTGTLRDVALFAQTYDIAGNVTSRQERPGTPVAALSRNTAGQVTEIVMDPGGENRRASFTYDPLGRLTGSRFYDSDDTLLSATRVLFDQFGRVETSGTLVAENPDVWRDTTYVYNQRGNVLRVTNPNGSYADTTYDAWGRAYLTELPEEDVYVHGEAPAADSATHLLGLNLDGDPVVAVDANGNQSTSTYDPAGRLLSMTRGGYTPPGSTEEIQLVESFTYDLAGRVLTQTRPGGYTTTFTYDSFDRQIRSVGDSIGSLGAPTVDVVFGDANLTVAVVSPTGATTHERSDEFGQIREWIAEERIPTTFSASTTFGYDDAGNLLSVTDPLDATSTTTYNVFGEALTTTDADGVELTFEYDGVGREVSRSDLLGRRINRVYDLAGDLVAEQRTDTNGTVLAETAFAYDAAGNPTSVTTPAGWVSTMTYDSLGRASTQVRNASPTESLRTRIGYDLAGQQTVVVNAADEEFWTTYNAWGLVESEIEPATTAHPDPADRSWTWTYDDTGRPTVVAFPGGTTVTQTYDEAGRLTARQGNGPTVATASANFEYDLVGNIVGFSHPGGTQQLAWNDRALLVGATGPAGNVTYGYDHAGRQVTETTPAGTLDVSYTDAGRISSITDPLSGTRNHTYDSAGQLVEVTHPGGVTRDLTWDDLGRLSAETVTDQSATLLHSLAYTYDLNDNPTTRTLGPAGVAGAGTHTYGYDQADRLTSWTDPASVATTYTYDPAGNRIASGSATFTYDERNRLLTSSGAHLVDNLDWTAAGTLDTVTTTAGATDVVVVVTDSANLTDAESTLLQILGAAGHTVTTRDATDPESIGNAKGVVIAPGVAATDLGDKYSTVAVGVVNLAPDTWDDHLLATSTVTVTDDELDVVEASHYLAAGLTGTITVTSTPGSISTAAVQDMAPGATPVAAAATDDTAIFAVPEGAELNDSTTSTGRRVAFGMEGVDDLDPAGEALLDAAIDWALGASHDTFAFDAFERMVASNGITLTYDARNRIATRDGVANTYAGVNLEPISIGDTNFARLGTQLLAQDHAGTTTVPIHNTHGDLIATLDPTAGALASTVAFDPWGAVIDQTGSQSPLGFQGQYTDPDTGAVSMQARWYAPGLGVFASRDTLTLAPGANGAPNRHAYADANPMRYSDPTGHNPALVGCAPAALVGGVGAVACAGAVAGGLLLVGAFALYQNGEISAPSFPNPLDAVGAGVGWVGSSATSVWHSTPWGGTSSTPPRPNYAQANAASNAAAATAYVAWLEARALEAQLQARAEQARRANAADIAANLFNQALDAALTGLAPGAPGVLRCTSGCGGSAPVVATVGGYTSSGATYRNLPTAAPPRSVGESGTNTYGMNGIDPVVARASAVIIQAVATDVTAAVRDNVIIDRANPNSVRVDDGIAQRDGRWRQGWQDPFIKVVAGLSAELGASRKALQDRDDSRECNIPVGTIGPYSALTAGNKGQAGCEAHHIIQDSAILGVKHIPGHPANKYSSSAAPAIVLSREQHARATAVQRTDWRQGTYADEEAVGRQALEAAGLDRHLQESSMTAVEVYFEDILGFEPETITKRWPGGGWRHGSP